MYVCVCVWVDINIIVVCRCPCNRVYVCVCACVSVCVLLFALRYLNNPEHGSPGRAHNRPCPLSLEYVSSVWSSRCRLRAGCSQRYLGPRPALRTPAMAVSRGPGFRVCRSVDRSVGYWQRGRGGGVACSVEPGVGACARSGSCQLYMLVVRVKFALKTSGSSADQVRVKASGLSVGQVRAKASG